MWPPVPLGGCLATRLPDLEGTRGVERSHHWSLTPHPWALARTACQSFPVKSIGISARPYRTCYRPRPGGFAGWDAGWRKRGVLRTHLGHRREGGQMTTHPGLARPSLEDGFSYGRAGGRRRHRHRGGRSRGGAALARDVVVSGMVERLVERVGGKVLSADGTGQRRRSLQTLGIPLLRDVAQPARRGEGVEDREARLIPARQVGVEVVQYRVDLKLAPLAGVRGDLVEDDDAEQSALVLAGQPDHLLLQRRVGLEVDAFGTWF